MADIVLPATMFMEHDDLYYGGGHQHISVGAKLIDPPGECRSNHEVLQGLGRRLNAVHPGFEMTPRELIDATLKKSGHGDIETPGSGSMARYPAGFSHLALSRRLRTRRQEISLQGRLGEPAVRHCRAWVRGRRCRRCRITGRSSRKRTRRIRSGSPPARRAAFSTPVSMRRRRRIAREGAPSVMIHPGRRRSLSGSPMATP